MKTGAKAGGWAALVMAACYLFGFGLLATAMNPGDTSGWTALQRLEFVLSRQALFQLWNLVIYVVFGIALVVLTVVLYRMSTVRDSLVSAIAAPFGLIWSGLVIASGMVISVGLTVVAGRVADDPTGATALWQTLGVVQNGLGGGVEIVGGLWVLLVSLAGLQGTIALPRWLNGFGLVVGVAGMATIVPALTELGAVFGLTQIAWFIGIGVVLLRMPRQTTD